MVSHPFPEMKKKNAMLDCIHCEGKELLLDPTWVLQVLLSKYAASFVELINLPEEGERDYQGWIRGWEIPWSALHSSHIARGSQLSTWELNLSQRACKKLFKKFRTLTLLWYNNIVLHCTIIMILLKRSNTKKLISIKKEKVSIFFIWKMERIILRLYY